MIIETGIISSQLLIRHEKRTTTRVSALNSALAHEIRENWSILPVDMINLRVSEWRKQLGNVIYRSQENIFRDGAQHVISAVGRKNEQLDFILNLIRPELRRYSVDQATVIEGYLRERIQKELISGLTPVQVRNNIVKILTTKHYAARIARTEAHTALERGAFEAAKSLGIRVTKEWVTRGDNRVREAHAAVHGQVKELLQPFIVGGEEMMFPGDPKASAKNRANCRCTINYRIG